MCRNSVTKKVLLNFYQENISMDFILEMREAFQLFDKVSFGAKAFQQNDNQHNGILRNEFQYNNIECSHIQQNDIVQKV